MVGGGVERPLAVKPHEGAVAYMEKKPSILTWIFWGLSIPLFSSGNWIGGLFMIGIGLGIMGY
jgi:hypothetical protein